jgi:hypothetical protein
MNVPTKSREAFREIAQACFENVREMDSGTRVYDWYFTQDETICMLRLTFRDSEAVLEHMANLGELFGKRLSVVDLDIKVFGEPSPLLRQALEGMDVTYFEPFLKLNEVEQTAG